MTKLENHCYLSIQEQSALLVRRYEVLDERMVFIEFTFTGLALPNGNKLKDRKNKGYRRPGPRRTYTVSRKPTPNAVHHCG